MLATIACPSCKVHLKTPDKLLGKTIHCPKCKKPVKLLVRNGPVGKPPAPPENRDAPPTPPKPPVEEVSHEQPPVDDFSALDEIADTPAKPEEAAESPAPGETMEEAVDELIEEEAPEEGGAVEEAAPEVVEEEETETGELSSVAAKFLNRQLFLIKGQTGLFSLNAAWDFLDPETKKKTGTAVERPEGILQVIRFFLRRNWLPSKIEIREEKTNELVFVVHRHAYFFNCKLEVRDADNQLLAKFTYKPLSRMVGKPMEILRKNGEKAGLCQFYFLKGRVDWVDGDNKELANMMTESAYTKSLKIYWAPRGGSYYVTFNPPLADQPHDKMIFLGVTLALDLLQEDAKQGGKGAGGISIGS